MVELGKGSIPHARQHGSDITPPLLCLGQDQAGQPQRRHHRIRTPAEAKVQHVKRSRGAVHLPVMHGFDVSQAIQDVLKRLGLAPVCDPARHIRPAFLPLEPRSAISRLTQITDARNELRLTDDDTQLDGFYGQG
jgi:hypothetical protein